MNYEEMKKISDEAAEEIAEIFDEYLSKRAEIISRIKKYLITIRQCLGELKLLHKSLQISVIEEGETVVISTTVDYLFDMLEKFLNEYHYKPKNKGGN